MSTGAAEPKKLYTQEMEKQQQPSRALVARGAEREIVASPAFRSRRVIILIITHLCRPHCRIPQHTQPPPLPPYAHTIKCSL
jgi:hypothetical protein